MQDWEYKQWEKRKKIRDANWKLFDKQSMKRAKSYDDIDELVKYHKIINYPIGNYQTVISDTEFAKNIKNYKQRHSSEYNSKKSQESVAQLKRAYRSQKYRDEIWPKIQKMVKQNNKQLDIQVMNGTSEVITNLRPVGTKNTKLSTLQTNSL